jgi:hypothetical protein
MHPAGAKQVDIPNKDTRLQKGKRWLLVALVGLVFCGVIGVASSPIDSSPIDQH